MKKKFSFIFYVFAVVLISGIAFMNFSASSEAVSKSDISLSELTLSTQSAAACPEEIFRQMTYETCSRPCSNLTFFCYNEDPVTGECLEGSYIYTTTVEYGNSSICTWAFTLDNCDEALEVDCSVQCGGGGDA